MRAVFVSEPSRVTRRRGWRKAVAGQATALAFVAPAAVVLGTFLGFPILYSLVLSFSSYNIAYDDAPKFAGIQNYVALTQDPYFWEALRHTVVFAVLFYPLSVVISLACALLVHNVTKGATFFRTAIFLPVIVPLSFAAVIWLWVFNKDFGILNYLISVLLRQPGWAVNWIQHPGLALPSIVGVTLWASAGLTMTIFLAGLMGIPRDYYEAAKIDGAGPLQELWYITLPNLRESMVVVSVWALVAAFKVFTQIWVMTRGGPGTETLTLYVYIYQTVFTQFKFGYGAAIAYVLTVIVVGFALLTDRIFGGEKA